ncbi:MAG: type I restriction enzyme HsdR N-terminal domain-containing protein [Acetobacteraceae bacterium]|nr:type I restriction enzyme HsdR N-terminal domain-containing protein [Acetobacteraceae bacterium]
MTLHEELPRLRTRAERASELLTEEATKNALVMPMLRALGYDVFDPLIVIPEFVADVGIKKGEKVDYAVKNNDKISILIECKPCQSDLAKEHASQLYRYFSVTEARFGVLTNGIEWRFFTDLDAPNKMDSKPFFIFSLLEYTESDLAELEKFSATTFSVDGILSAANDLKFKSLIVEQLRREMLSPSDDFVRLIGKRIYESNLTGEIRSRFTALITVGFQEIIREHANFRLKSALQQPSSEPAAQAAPVAVPATLDEPSNGTTEEELEAFRIIKALVRGVAKPNRIAMRDQASYCAILFDDNNRKPLARLYFNSKKKRVGIFMNKEERRHDIETLDDLYALGDELVASASVYASVVAPSS